MIANIFNTKKPTAKTTTKVVVPVAEESLPIVGKTSFGLIPSKVEKVGSFLTPIAVEQTKECKSSIDFIVWLRAFSTKFPHLTYEYKRRSTAVKKWRYYFRDRNTNNLIGFFREDVLTALEDAKHANPLQHNQYTFER